MSSGYPFNEEIFFMSSTRMILIGGKLTGHYNIYYFYAKIYLTTIIDRKFSQKKSKAFRVLRAPFFYLKI